jgi:hypothetical protein
MDGLFRMVQNGGRKLSKAIARGNPPPPARDDIGTMGARSQ